MEEGAGLSAGSGLVCRCAPRRVSLIGPTAVRSMPSAPRRHSAAPAQSIPGRPESHATWPDSCGARKRRAPVSLLISAALSRQTCWQIRLRLLYPRQPDIPRYGKNPAAESAAGASYRRKSTEPAPNTRPRRFPFDSVAEKLAATSARYPQAQNPEPFRQAESDRTHSNRRSEKWKNKVQPQRQVF